MEINDVYLDSSGVIELLRRNLSEAGYNQEVIENAEQLWGDYGSLFDFEVRDRRVYTAAIEYTITKLAGLPPEACLRRLTSKGGQSPMAGI